MRVLELRASSSPVTAVPAVIAYGLLIVQVVSGGVLDDIDQFPYSSWWTIDDHSEADCIAPL